MKSEKSGKPVSSYQSTRWWKLSLPLPVSKSFQQKLWEQQCTGFYETDQMLHAYFPYSEHFPEIFQQKNFQRFMNNAVWEVIPAEDWEAGWKKHFKPIRVGQRFIIRPSWENYPAKKGDRVLIIDPKMSFGTGTHPTTQLMLRLMEHILLHHKKVLDAGTGTGILAIGAVKLGARQVIALDVEQESVDNAKENVRKNHCNGKIRIKKGSFTDVPKRSRYDVILANIQRSVLEPHLDFFSEHLTEDGYVLLSGILKEESSAFAELLKRAGWRILSRRSLKEWTAFLLTPKKIDRIHANRRH